MSTGWIPQCCPGYLGRSTFRGASGAVCMMAPGLVVSAPRVGSPDRECVGAMRLPQPRPL